ncbi:MAG: hypothetical protein CL920_03760 [Deltaproteobacteria bacterium]|nr:hypothetical protein [Deltaproteobacteria bacterium]
MGFFVRLYHVFVAVFLCSFLAGCGASDEPVSQNKLELPAFVSPVPHDLKGLFLLCERGDGESCYQLARSYAHGVYGPEDRASARFFYQLACTHRFVRACVYEGWFFQRGVGVRKDLAKAFQRYQHACKLGYGNGCSHAGFMLQKGLGRRKDFYKALAFYQKACRLRSGLGCQQVGRSYQKGYGTRKSDAKALFFYQKACALDYRIGCFNEGYFFEKGRGHTKDCVRSGAAFQKACRLGCRSCCQRGCPKKEDDHRLFSRLRNASRFARHHVLIVDGARSVKKAKQKQKRIREKGLKTDLLWSNDYSSMRPGWYILVARRARSSRKARYLLRRLKRKFPGAYVRFSGFFWPSVRCRTLRFGRGATELTVKKRLKRNRMLCFQMSLQRGQHVILKTKYPSRFQIFRQNNTSVEPLRERKSIFWFLVPDTGSYLIRIRGYRKFVMRVFVPPPGTSKDKAQQIFKDALQ